MSAPADMNTKHCYTDLLGKGTNLNNPNSVPHYNDEVLLVSGSYDHTIRFWSADKGFCERIIQNPDSCHVNRLAISPSREVIVSGGFQHIRMYEVESANNQPLINFEGISKNVTSIGFNKRGNFMYSGGEDGYARIWDVRARRIACEREVILKSPINHMFLHPNEVEVFIADQSGSVWIWNLQTEHLGRLFVTSDSFVNHMSYDPENRLLACVDSIGNCYIFRSASFIPKEMLEEKHGQTTAGGFLHRKLMFKAHDKFGLKCIFSPDSTMLATTSADQTVKFWRTADFTLTNPTSTVMMDDPMDYQNNGPRKYDPAQKLSFRNDITDMVDENLLNNQSAAFLGAPYFASLFSYGIQQPKPPQCYLKRRKRRKRCSLNGEKSKCCKQFSSDCATCYSYRHRNWQNPYAAYQQSKVSGKNHHHHNTNYSMFTAYYRNYFDNLSLNVMEQPCDGLNAEEFDSLESNELHLDHQFHNTMRVQDLIDSDFDLDFTDDDEDVISSDDEFAQTLNDYISLSESNHMDSEKPNRVFCTENMIPDEEDISNSFSNGFYSYDGYNKSYSSNYYNYNNSNEATGNGTLTSNGNGQRRRNGNDQRNHNGNDQRTRNDNNRRVECCCSCDCFTKDKMDEIEHEMIREEKERKNKNGGHWNFSTKVVPTCTLTTQNQKWVWDIAFSADSQYIFTASSDQFVRLWGVQHGDLKREYAGHGKAVTCLALCDSIA